MRRWLSPVGAVVRSQLTLPEKKFDEQPFRENVKGCAKSGGQALKGSSMSSTNLRELSDSFVIVLLNHRSGRTQIRKRACRAGCATLAQ